MKPHKTLKPIAVVLPGLLAASSFATWTPQTSTFGTGFYATANGDTGFTQAKYDRAGFQVSCHRRTTDNYRCCGNQQFDNNLTSDLVVNASTWSENSYAWGKVHVWSNVDSSLEAWARVDSSF